MINIKSYLDDKKFSAQLEQSEPVKQRKVQEWQTVAEEISNYYNVKAYYLVAPYRHDLTSVRYAFKEAQTRNKPFSYLAAMLKLTKVK